MESSHELVKAEKSTNYTRYLLIIGILALSFSLSFLLRALPLEYGFELNEYDPFFNYRATEFMVENGLPAYLEWHDDLSWYQYGRDVSATSQVMLHVTGATLYQIFGMGATLYNFTVWFPVVIGSLTTVVIFALVRTIGGTTAGLFASIFFAVSPIIILRGTIGWYKSEPLGLFFGLLAIYLLISAIKSDKGKISLAKIVGGGILLAFGLASWGGIQFFIITIGLFFLILPFLRKDDKFIMWISVIFSSVFLLVTISFEKSGVPFISSLTGFFLIGCTIFLVVATLIKKISSKTQLRNTLALLGAGIIAGIALISSGLVNLPAFRYLNAANPFLGTDNVLVGSVSEHATSTIEHSFYFMSVLMIFAGIGAWLLFQKKVNRSLNIKYGMAAFALIIGFLGIYFSSAFVRLEVLGSISVIILSSIGISILISKILSQGHGSRKTITKISFLVVIVALLTVPMVYPTINWSTINQGAPIVILNSSTHYDISTNDWLHAMQWLKENTHEGAVIAAWWDYGYWITTLSERKTLADNATTLDWQITKIASSFMTTPNDGWKILVSDAETDVSTHFASFPITDSSATNLEERKLELFTGWQVDDKNGNGIINKEEGNNWWVGYPGEEFCNNGPVYGGKDCPKYWDNPGKINQYANLFDYWETEVYGYEPPLTGLDADYIIVNLAVRKYATISLSENNTDSLYRFDQKGGDENKALWFMKIAGLQITDYYQKQSQSYTDKFWDETLLEHLIPFTFMMYIDPNNPDLQSNTFKPGYIAVYVKDVKFPTNGDGPFELVYVSPSFERDESGPLTGPLIYKINKNYNPNQ